MAASSYAAPGLRAQGAFSAQRPLVSVEHICNGVWSIQAISRQHVKSGRSRVLTRAGNPIHDQFRDRRVVQHERLQDFIELTNAKDPKHQKPPTVKSLVLYVPAWLRYYAIPSPLKYIVYAIVRAVLTAHYKWKKWAVLQGARLDDRLQTQAYGTSRVEAGRLLRRLHGKESVLDTLRYRWALFKDSRAAKPLAASS